MTAVVMGACLHHISCEAMQLENHAEFAGLREIDVGCPKFEREISASGKLNSQGRSSGRIAITNLIRSLFLAFGRCFSFVAIVRFRRDLNGNESGAGPRGRSRPRSHRSNEFSESEMQWKTARPKRRRRAARFDRVGQTDLPLRTTFEIVRAAAPVPLAWKPNVTDWPGWILPLYDKFRIV